MKVGLSKMKMLLHTYKYLHTPLNVHDPLRLFPERGPPIVEGYVSTRPLSKELGVQVQDVVIWAVGGKLH
jgi:hypothetical protein